MPESSLHTLFQILFVQFGTQRKSVEIVPQKRCQGKDLHLERKMQLLLGYYKRVLFKIKRIEMEYLWKKVVTWVFTTFFQYEISICSQFLYEYESACLRPKIILL